MIEVLSLITVIVIVYFVSLVAAGLWMMKYPNSKVTKILLKVFNFYNKVLK